MDVLDRELVNALLHNGRLTFRQLASKAGVSVGTALNRVRRLEKTGVIRKYSALVDYDLAGYVLDAIISLKIVKGKYKDVYEKIVADNCVVAAYDVTGETDSVLIAKFKNKQGLDRFLKKLQEYEFIEKTSTQIILNIVKEEPLFL